MFDLGDELIIGSHKIPWLLWIQLLVMLLLIILLYHFTVFAFGLDLSTTAAASSSNSGSSTHRPLSNAAATVLLHNSKVGDTPAISGNTGASAIRRRVGREEEGDGSSSAKDAAHSSVSERPHHLCHFFGLAKQAFLKCLGLDPTSKDPSNARQRREE